MIDADIAFTPGWWMKKLAKQLRDRQPELQLLDDWYRGQQPLPKSLPLTATDVYKEYHKLARTTYARRIVSATRERMTPVGFHTAVDNDASGDKLAWEYWQANDLDVQIADVLTSMLAMRYGYMIVNWDPATKLPLITGEDPRHVITVHDPVQQRIVRAALKMFHDDDLDMDFAYLFLRGEKGRKARVYVARRAVKRLKPGAPDFSPKSWEWSGEHGGINGRPLRTSDVPVVRFINQDELGEFEPHLDLLRRIDQNIFQRLVVVVLQAFRQRAITGDWPELHPVTGEKMDYDKMLKGGPDAVWQLPLEAVVTELGQVDLRPLIDGEKQNLEELAASTSTPMPTLLPGDGTDSAEGAVYKRESHTFKVEDRIVRTDAPLKDVMVHAFLAVGDTERAQRGQLKVLWKPIERVTKQAKAAAAVSARDAGVPWRSRMVDYLDYPPEEVVRLEKESAEDDARAQKLAEKAPNPAKPPVPVAA